MRAPALSAALAPALGSLLLLAACADGAVPDEVAAPIPSYHEIRDPSVYDSALVRSDLTYAEPEHVNAQLALPDGRRVAFHHVDGQGLAEQHYSPTEDAWTAPRLIHRTDEDYCQGIALAYGGGTVAVTADWGIYCYDGEPPTESLAGVGTGDLTAWDVDITEDFDGWESSTVSDDGRLVTWTYHSTRLTWERGDFELTVPD